MTATAFIHDPLLDQSTDPGPRLRLVPGGFDSTGSAAGGVGAGRPGGLHPAVELGRRRRFLVALGLSVVVVVVTQLLGYSLTSFGPVASTEESVRVVHVVRPGDTYGAIAADLGVADPAAFAVELRALNGGAELVAGERLVLDPDRLSAS